VNRGWLSEGLRRGSRTTAAIGLCLLGACVQGPNYVRPALDIPAAYRNSTAAPLAAADAGSWWSELGDPRLNRLVQEALANNGDLKIATARVDEFAAIVAGTRSQAFPHVGYDLSATHSRGSEEVIPGFVKPVSSDFSAILTASWELDLWGRIHRETEAAQANLLATEEARRGVVLTLISSVITGYVTLLDLDEQLRIAQANVEGRRQWVDLFRAQLAHGYISDFTMTQATAWAPAARRQFSQ